MAFSSIAHQHATLKKARSKAGLTQAQAAELIRVRPDAWELWEEGLDDMPYYIFEAFQEAVKAQSREEALVIRNARLAAGLTQAQAAALVSVATPTWIAWERGRAIMRPSFLDYFLHKTRGIVDLRSAFSRSVEAALKREPRKTAAKKSSTEGT